MIMAKLGIILIAVLGLTIKCVLALNDRETHKILQDYRTNSHKRDQALMNQTRDGDYVSQEDFDKAISALMSSVDSLTLDMHKLENRITDEVTPRIDGLEENYKSATIKLCQTGEADGCEPYCDYSTSTTVEKDISYPVAFDKTPFLYLALVGYDDLNNSPIKYKFYSKDETASGFTLVFSWYDDARTGRAGIRWLACA